MAPKKAAAGAPKKAATANHPSYVDMIKEAIIGLKERNGSSRQAVKKYVQSNNNLTGVTDAQFTLQFNRALQRGSDNGTFNRPKGPSGPVKLAAPKTSEAKPAAKAKAPAAKKATTTKTATKKAPAKKTTVAKPATTKKAPAKKTTSSTKTKANTGKARKTKAAPTAAPAVEEKAPVVLGKTKSGRVTKSKAPQPAKKAAASKKAGTAKTTKKAATPKKA